ncbi:MAG: ArsR/SmtB family transcription factor [Flavisolibacter sp.]
MQTTQIQQELSVDTIRLRKAAMVLRAINHPLRQQMLKMIHQAGKMTVTELYTKLRLEQSVASQHLGILRVAGLATTERKSKNIFYSVNHERLDFVHQVTAELVRG